MGVPGEVVAVFSFVVGFEGGIVGGYGWGVGRGFEFPEDWGDNSQSGFKKYVKMF